MNYYGTNYNGSFYPNSPYNNYTQQQAQVQQFPIQQQQMGLNGKIVDSEDMVKATEVPIGGYGIFPKADLSEIFVKTWNNNGTTSIVKYAAVAPQTLGTSTIEDSQSKILSRIDSLESKLDSLIQTKIQVQTQTQDIYPTKN